MRFKGGILILRMLLLSKNDKLGIDKTTETLKESIKKLQEEHEEVLSEAICIDYFGFNRNHELAQELLDVVQMAAGMLRRMSDDKCIDVEDEMAEHNTKLLKAGWTYDSEIYIEVNGTGNKGVKPSYNNVTDKEFEEFLHA